MIYPGTPKNGNFAVAKRSNQRGKTPGEDCYRAFAGVESDICMPSCVLTFRSAPIALLGVTVWFALASANRLFATDPRIYLIERFGTNQITIHFDTDANRTYELQYTSTLQCRTNVSGQYYLRTKGEQGFEFGDEIIVSGGPARTSSCMMRGR